MLPNLDPSRAHAPSLRADIADFWHFLRAPSLRHRAAWPGRMVRLSGVKGIKDTDWAQKGASLSLGRLLGWVALLWAINLFALGPLAAAVATLSGVHHKLEVNAIPWFNAVIWAPLVEEMIFRYGLRRPQQIGWVVPLMLWPLFKGPDRVTVAVVALVFILVSYAARKRKAMTWRWHWRRHYVRQFPWVLHGAALMFAGMHLGNFSELNRISLWLLPLLVLPQWLTGLVLSWMRVRRGICASMLMHSVFNAGPLLLILGLWKWASQT